MLIFSKHFKNFMHLVKIRRLPVSCVVAVRPNLALTLQITSVPSNQMTLNDLKAYGIGHICQYIHLIF